MTRFFFVLLLGWPCLAVAQEGRVPYQPVPLPQLPYEPPVVVDVRVGSVSEDSEREMMRRITDVYRVHVRHLEAMMADDVLSAESALLDGLSMLQSIIDEYPEAASNRRYTELYRTVMIEYHAFYGITEPIRDSEGEIFAILDEMFAIQDDLLNDETLVIPRVEEPNTTTTVPLIINAQVQAQLNYLTQRRPEIMERWLDRSTVYFPMMRRIFKEEGVPEELIHLSMVESGLVPIAASRARAVGLWQFIKATGSYYGLEANYWMDERRDPHKSTRAAARHLRDLYAHWGDWHLALANYNVSTRRMRSSIQLAGGTRDYWAIFPYLPKETRGYVPIYIAATMVALNPEDYGFKRPPVIEEFQFDVVEVPGGADLNALARIAGMTGQQLREYNPELLRSSTPPGPRPYPLKVPDGRGEMLKGMLREAPIATSRDATIHTVKAGESLGIIANRHGLTVADLYESNPTLKSTIHPGQTIAIPVPGGSNVPILADQPSRARTAASASNASGASTQVASYRVRSGDTLSTIASRHGMSVRQLKNLNNLNSDRIRAGQVLRVASGGR